MRSSLKSRVGTFWCIVAISICLSQLVYAQQLSAPLVLYDNFDERFLNPAKWSLGGACSFSVLECVREIQDERLQLAARNYGATSSNDGVQYAPSELHFRNPAPVRTIATQFTVQHTSAMPCPANTALFNSHAHTILQGTFFNSGSGNSADDVQGLLLIDHADSDPQGVLTVLGLMYWQGQFFGGVGLGTINVGQKVIAELSWDQPNRQFVVSWTDVLTSTRTEAFMPYTMADSTPPAAPDKLIAIRTWVPNCVGSQMLVTDMATAFDKVWIRN